MHEFKPEDYQIELDEQHVKVGKVTLCIYLDKYKNIDTELLAETFARVVQAAQNPIVAVNYVAEKLGTESEFVLLSVLEYQLWYFGEGMNVDGEAGTQEEQEMGCVTEYKEDKDMNW